MVDTQRLKEAIKNKGLKLSYVSSQLGLSSYGLARKINNKSDFRVSEALKMTELLSLDAAERDAIFFSQYVEL